ncbi:hypothetical protein CBR_g36554 [Chara braunii]|uniref:Uncharacterized protein n=1 Tax=Chara braunii TaxID=69332 RepID=A0A388JZ34_CHABU|nr:hypothetical protein CBR_g36554 [Chara braunii]|eukprot:GBG63069.1 hypothetical protein CBR_g36554 [Chara braunii]
MHQDSGQYEECTSQSMGCYKNHNGSRGPQLRMEEGQGDFSALPGHRCYDCQGFGLISCPQCGKAGLTPEQRGER